MTTILILFTIIGLLGAFDTLYHHEIKERRPWRPEVKDELKAHALRNVFYGVIFLSLGWMQWQGLLAWLFLAILLTEIFVTFWDFALENRVRNVPAPEIIVHTLLGIVYGATLSFLIPEVMSWSENETAFVGVEYGLFSWVMMMYALAVWIFALHDFSRAKEINNFRQEYSISLAQKKQKVLITGGSGFIGSKVTQALIDDGHDVTLLTRNFTKSSQKFTKQIRLIESLEGCEEHFDIIVNLAGEKINQRWTKESKEAILESRVKVTDEVIQFIKRSATKPKVVLSSSGTGIYKNSQDEKFTELSEIDKGTLTADVCREWEAKINEVENETRVVILRTGLVLATDGGVLSEMLPAFDLGVGGRLADGQQMMPWIDIHDMIGIIEKAMNDENLRGVVNATSPNPVNNLAFSKSLAKALRRPLLLSTPIGLMYLLFGKEMVDELLLKGRAVMPEKIQEHGYVFKFPYLEDSMNKLFGRGV